MTNKQRCEIINFANKLTDDELEKEYYNSVYNCLGSLCEDMYEMGYDIVDIVEREKHEKYLSERCNLLERICVKRGIKLWEEYDVK